MTLQGYEILDSELIQQNYNANLFPEFSNYKDYDSIYEYVERVLCKLANNKKLFLTEIINQNNKFVNKFTNECLTGFRQDETGFLKQNLLHNDLSEYTVKIKALDKNAKTLEYKAGKRKYKTKMKAPIYADVIRHLKLDESGCVYVNIQTAIMILKQSGKFYRKAANSHHRSKVWKCEEIKPINYSTEELVKVEGNNLAKQIANLNDESINNLLAEIQELRGKKDANGQNKRAKSN